MQQLTKAAITSVLFAAMAFGQGGRSTILGTVTDQSGAPVPKVAVTVTNTGTQQQRSTITSERGDFEITALDVATTICRRNRPASVRPSSRVSASKLTSVLAQTCSCSSAS